MFVRYQIEEYPTATGYVSELIIMQVDRKDSAVYSCYASNNYGSDDISIALIVQGKNHYI